MILENDIRIVRIDQTEQVATQAARAQDWANLEKYRSENEKLKTNKNHARKTVFMGDSITEGWKDLNPKFFSKNNFINRGIGGQTTPQMLIRFKPDVIHLDPDLVIILAGTNDIAGNSGPSSVNMILDNIFSMAEIARCNDINVFLCSILPVYAYPWNDKIKDVPKIISSVNSQLKKFAKYNELTYVDYYSEMVSDNHGLESIYAHDGVHPTKDGYDVMENVIQSSLSNSI